MTTISAMCNVDINMLNGTASWANKRLGNEQASTEKVIYSPKIDPWKSYAGLESTMCSNSGINSLDDFKSACQFQMEIDLWYYAHDGISPDNVEINPDFDYEKEYQKYMESRGCKDEKELQALNKAGYPTRGVLEEMVAMNVSYTIANLHGNGLTSTHIHYDDIMNMCSKMSIDELASYGKSENKTGSPFLDMANDLDAFLKMASKSDSVDDDMKKILEQLMQNIADSYDNIADFSKMLDEELRLSRLEEPKTPAYQETEEYRALLIEKYAA